MQVPALSKYEERLKGPGGLTAPPAKATGHKLKDHIATGHTEVQQVKGSTLTINNKAPEDCRSDGDRDGNGRTEISGKLKKKRFI